MILFIFIIRLTGIYPKRVEFYTFNMRPLKNDNFNKSLAYSLKILFSKYLLKNHSQKNFS